MKPLVLCCLHARADACRCAVQAEAQAAASKARREAEQAQDAEDQRRTYHSALLSEQAGPAGSVDGFKGMSDAQRAEYRAAQLAQVCCCLLAAGFGLCCDYFLL